MRLAERYDLLASSGCFWVHGLAEPTGHLPAGGQRIRWTLYGLWEDLLLNAGMVSPDCASTCSRHLHQIRTFKEKVNLAAYAASLGPWAVLLVQHALARTSHFSKLCPHR
jgi:hypothetical protein